MKKFIFLCLLFISQKVLSQTETPTPKFALKLDLTSLIDPFNTTAMLSGEYKISPYFGLQLGAGYIFHDIALNNLWQSEGKGMIGWKGKLEPRIYFIPGKNDPDLEGPYVALPLMYKWESMKYEQFINQSGFTEINEFRRIKTVFSIHVAGGYQFVLGKRIIFDFYGGIGTRVRNNTFEDYIGSEPENIEDFNLFGGKTSPSITLGCRFGVAL